MLRTSIKALRRITPLSAPNPVKGGVILAIDSATGDIARTTNGWIEDERFGVYFAAEVADVTAEFDSAISRTGRLSAYILTTNATGRGRFIIGRNANTGSTYDVGSLSKYAIPVKPSTVYRMSAWIRYANIVAGGALISFNEHTVDGTRVAAPVNGLLSGTSDWVRRDTTFTTTGTTAFLVIAAGPAIAGDAQEFRIDINSMTLEEVTTVTNPDSTPALLIPTFTAVTSVNNIDQATDPTGAFPNTYSLLTAISEGATHRETFTPTKKYQTRYGVWVVAKGTGNLTMTVHTAANVVVASSTILNASLVNGQFNYFDVPYIWTAGAHHIHVTSTVADATLKVNTASDLETSSFIMQYAKKSENFTVATDTETLRLTSDQDGILSGAVIDLEAGTYNYQKILFGSGAVAGDNERLRTDLFSSAGFYSTTNYPALAFQGGVMSPLVWKINTILPSKVVTFSQFMQAATDGSRYYDVHYSFDNVNWIGLGVAENNNDTLKTYTFDALGNSVFFIRIQNNTLGGGLKYIKRFILSATLETSPVTFPSIAPGVNNVYLSANSPAASSDQDPSLESIYSAFIGRNSPRVAAVNRILI